MATRWDWPTLEQLEALAQSLRSQGVDTKWVQLSGLLSTDQAMFGPDGSRRKLLIFSEHRDTMSYLVDRLRTFLGDAAAVECISGSTPREVRRRVQARFTQDESCLVLVATDAAGEGINLQRAHLVINYDMPWNPNRIEQQRVAYQGQVFDVLGEALSGAELRRLLLDAIRYGDDPAVRERITFDKESIRQVGSPPAELVAPGHPLLSATIDLILERHRGLFTQGAVLVDETDRSEEPQVLVMLEHSIADGRPTRTQPHTVVSRRFEFVGIDGSGKAVAAGYAPYLDCRPPTDAENSYMTSLFEAEWLNTDLEAIGTGHAITVAVPQHLTQVRLHTEHRVDATLAAVKERLTREINYWTNRANELQVRASAGQTPQSNADRARQRADQLAERLQQRTGELRAERSLRALPPVVVGGALVVPAGLLRRPSGSVAPAGFSLSRAEVLRRAVDAVLATEGRLGWQTVDLNEAQRNNPGFDIRSRQPGLGDGAGDVKFILRGSPSALPR